MTFDIRFGSVFSMVEIELANSFPICNKTEEILFFYSTVANDEFSYKIGEIKYIFSRNIESGKINKIDFNSDFKDIINSCRDIIIQPTVIDEEAYDAEDRYYELYEQFYKVISDEKNDVTNKLRQELYEEFETLVPVGKMRELYFALGKSYFEMLKAN